MINLDFFRKYFIDSFFLAFPRMFIILVSLITLPIVLRSLDVGSYGEFQFILAVQVWAVVFSGSYITSGSRRGIARGLDGTFIYAFLARIRVLIIISLIGFIVSFYLYFVGLTNLSILLVIISLFISFGYLFEPSILSFFIAKKQFKYSAIWRSSVSLLSIVISTIVAYYTHNIVLFVFVKLGSTAIVGCISWMYLVKKNRLILAYKEKKIDKECIPYGRKLIFAEVLSGTTNKLSSFIIGPSFGFPDLAIFSIADKLDENFRGFMNIFNSLFYSDFAKNDEKKVIRVFKSKFKQGMVISILITLLSVFAGYFYINMFLPEFYQRTIIYFLILSLGLPVVILEILMHTILETNFRHKELTILMIAPNLIKILLISGLGLTFGIIGICWGTVLGSWLRFLLYYLLTIKKYVS